ncbi:hypothetical protein L6452_33031 [Arctium lappa]|uniref:Uncharacterized protein n=1 Tax=Arctium lappa TaxID=4217 RepID=A0ACB8Z661_ARCLA|nr:hypothetical protein L6452_33031 [Arctium lappa]
MKGRRLLEYTASKRSAENLAFCSLGNNQSPLHGEILVTTLTICCSNIGLSGNIFYPLHQTKTMPILSKKPSVCMYFNF